MSIEMDRIYAVCIIIRKKVFDGLLIDAQVII